MAHESMLEADEVEEADGIPVTSVSRTLFDLAAVVDRQRLERGMNEAEVRRLTSRLSLPDLLDRYPGRRGNAVLRDILRAENALSGVTRQELEARFSALLDARRLPRPRHNADIAMRGRFFEFDCLWREQRVIVELDGRAAHGTWRAFETDRARDRIFLAEGWSVMRVTWRQLRDEPSAVASDLRRLLAAPAVV